MFRARDLVLRRVFENTTDPTFGKFQPNWEGPYMIVKVGQPAHTHSINQTGLQYLGCGMLRILKGIIKKVSLFTIIFL